MQNFKPKFAPPSEQNPARKAERKSGIKEIICPESYAPIWQKAFALADNVRFTRTPDSELQRRRAALDPVYAEILAEAEKARAEREKCRAEAEAAQAEQAEKAPEAEPAAQAENAAAEEPAAAGGTEPARGGALCRALPEAAPAPETVLPQSAPAPEAPPAAPQAGLEPQAERESASEAAAAFAAVPAAAAPAAPLAAAAAAQAEDAPQAELRAAPRFSAPFPWEAGNAERARPLSAAAEYIRALAAPAASVLPFARRAGASERPPQPNPDDIRRLFKSMECRRPQMRWIPVAAQDAERLMRGTGADAPGAAAAPFSPPRAEAAQKAQSGVSGGLNAFYSREGFVSASGGWSPPALNLQVRVENYGNSGGAGAAQPAAKPEDTAAKPAAAANLDPPRSPAAEKNSAAAPRPARQTAAAADKAGLPAEEPSRAGQAEAENRVPAPARGQKEETAARAEAAAHSLPRLRQEAAKCGYQLPPLELLQQPHHDGGNVISQESLERSAGLLETVLEDFGVKGEIIHVRPGPVVTLYEFEPAPGVKSSRIINLADDIARSMSSVAARVAVIPGRNVIGIELPNKKREMVYLREILQSMVYKTSEYKLPLALGKNIGGEPVIAELAKMPHLLVAGTTGSGKSVAINTMILSLLYRMPPSRCRLIMVDPKMLELSVYDGIPHLLTPVVTDPKKAITALKWAVREMEDRYRKMAKLGVRNIDGFNARVKEALAKGETIMCNVQAGFDKETGELLYTEEAMDLTPLPYIVIIVDEMADLMMVAGKEIEGAIQRLAQMARAAGIHLIMATQRPSVDVITGTIKANFPTRISFQVTSRIDSRTILGEQGAETLLGQGDMLQMAGGGRLRRVHGPFVSDREVEKVVAYLKTQGAPEYLATVTESGDEEEQSGKNAESEGGHAAVAEIVAAAAGGNEDFDDLYIQAVKIVMRDRKCSTSYIQRRLGVGYNKAATLVEKMEEEGLVGEANHVGKREILA